MKNKLLFNHAADTLRTSFEVLDLAIIKQSDLPQVITFLRSQAQGLRIPADKVVHWESHQLEILTSYTTELHRHVLSLGREVNRIRAGQRRPMKNFVKEAQRSDEMIVIRKNRKEVDDAFKRSET